MKTAPLTEQQKQLNSSQLENSKVQLKKLPILGPAMWLYARDDLKKFTFIAEQDWLLIPPIILDQCKLYMREDIPWAFATWAFVSDEVDARLRTATPKIAPHEWKSGNHAWIIDVVAPFGDRDGSIDDLRNTEFSNKAVSAILVQRDGTVQIRDYPALASANAANASSNNDRSKSATKTKK